MKRDPDPAGDGKAAMGRPGFVGTLNRHGHDRYSCENGDSGETIQELHQQSVTRASPFWEDDHRLAGPEAPETLPNRAAVNFVRIDREGAVELQKPGNGPPSEELLHRHVADWPPNGGADQHRIKIALVIRDDQGRPCGGNVFKPRVPDPKDEGKEGPEQGLAKAYQPIVGRVRRHSSAVACRCKVTLIAAPRILYLAGCS